MTDRRPSPDGSRRMRKIGRAVRIVACAICMLTLLCGCWDWRYLDRLGVVFALGVDPDPTGKQKLQLTVQVVLPQNVASETKSSGGGPSVTTFTETGDTLFEAIRKMSNKTSRRLFFSHTQMLVISETMARRGIYPLVDLIERNPDIRKDIAVVITRDTSARDLLQITTQMESIPVNQLTSTVEVNQEAYGTNYAVYVKNIVRITGKGQEQLAIPAFRISGKTEAANREDNIKNIPAEAVPSLTTMAVFKEGKLVQFLTAKESRGLSWLREKIGSTVVKLACPQTEGHLMVEITSAKNMYKVKRDKEGQPFIEANLLLAGGIQEIMCPGIEVLEEEVLKQIAGLTSRTVTDEANAAVRALQKKSGSDALGWGKEVYMQKPELWKRIEDDWGDLFPNVKYQILCTTVITSSGVRSKSIVK